MPINEKARLEYLAAMGIKQWVARTPIVGAAESPRLVPIEEPTPKEQAAVGKPLLTDLKGAITDAPKDVAHRIKSISDEFKVARHNADVEDAPVELVKLNFSVFNLSPVMIICEQPAIDGIFGLQYPHRVLINDALRILLGAYDKNYLREDDFNWPWGAPAHSKGGCPEEAKLALSALVNARKPKLVLCLGDTIDQYLEVEDVITLQGPNFVKLIGDIETRQTLANHLLKHRIAQ